MDHQFRVVAATPRTLEPPQRRNQTVEDFRLVRAAGEELLLMGVPRVNVLVAGRDEVVRSVLHMLVAQVKQPVVSWMPGDTFTLPSIEHTGTLVLHEVGALRLQDQIQLLGWSAGAMGNTQVISTTSTPLLPRVSAGAFIDTLYYRLNTVYMDVSGADEEVWRD